MKDNENLAHCIWVSDCVEGLSTHSVKLTTGKD